MTRSPTTALFEPVQMTSGDVSLVAFQPSWINQAWDWLNEDRRANFDDYGPTTIQEFAADLLRRVEGGQVIFGVVKGGTPVGIIGFQPVTERLGRFAGIAIARHAQHQQVGTVAVGMLLLSLYAEGYEKIEAQFFADNEGVARLFRKLGGRHEGMLLDHTLRNGEPVDVKLVGFVKGRI